MSSLKCVVVGDHIAGMKTKMLLKGAYYIDSWEYNPVVFNPVSVEINIDENTYCLRLAETSGSEDVTQLRRNLYPETDVFLAVFSINSTESFKSIERKWVPEIKQHGPIAPFLIVGLADKSCISRKVSKNMAEEFAKKEDAYKYLDCSLKSKDEVDIVFREAVLAALEHRKKKLVRKLSDKLKPLSRWVEGARNAIKEAGSAVFVTEQHAPKEISSKDTRTLQLYQRAARHGTRPVYRTRIMLVGQERVGKTCLMKSILGEKYNPLQPITDGVDTSKVCKVPIQSDHKPGSAWILQRKGVHGRIKERKLSNNKAMTMDMAQQLWTLQVEESRQTSQIPLDDISGAYSQVPTDANQSFREISTKITCQANERVEVTGATAMTRSDEPALPSEVPVEIQKNLNKVLKQQRRNDEHALEFQFWDFGGQDVYYNAHQVFLNQRALFVLVFDISKNLNDKVEVGQFTFNQNLKQWMTKSMSPTQSRFHHFTGLEFIDFWLQSIYTYAAPIQESQSIPTSPNESSDADASLSQNQSHAIPKDSTQPFISPPILIVGTHSNYKRKRTNSEIQVEDEKKQQILNLIEGKIYEKHVILQIHTIENNPKDQSKEDREKTLKDLRMHICDILLKEPYMGERIPVRWLQFERALMEQAAKNTHYITLDEARQEGAEYGLTDDSEIITVLQFLHDLGTIIYFGTKEDTNDAFLNDLVILDPQWLIDVIRQIITVQPKREQWAKFCDKWNLLASQAILKESLINHLWKKYLHLKDKLLAIMERFDLLCPQYADDANSEEEKAYYIPACLQPPAEPLQSVDKQTLGDDISEVTFYLNFWEYLPDAIFNYLTVYAARWSQEKFEQRPKLLHRFGRYLVGSEEDLHMFRLEMRPARPACVKVVIEKKQTYGQLENNRVSPEICNEIFQFMKETIEKLRQKWTRGLRYQLANSCKACRQERKTLHLLPLPTDLKNEKKTFCEFTEQLIPVSVAWKQLVNQQKDEDPVESTSSENTEADATSSVKSDMTKPSGVSKLSTKSKLPTADILEVSALSLPKTPESLPSATAPEIAEESTGAVDVKIAQQIVVQHHHVYQVQQTTYNIDPNTMTLDDQLNNQARLEAEKDLPDELIYWRAVLYQDDTRSRMCDIIDPIELLLHTPSMITLMQEQQIQTRCSNDSRMRGCQLLLWFLLCSSNPEWPELFLDGLRAVGADIYVTLLLQKLDTVREHCADHYRDQVSLSRLQGGGPAFGQMTLQHERVAITHGAVPIQSTSTEV
ncbi:uncharacterized protein [Amphiura filiformis]|uniref:uncharacterized protein n=1 Tax=Amphiura filiformis TaxID=82378 RepID=UPI003B2132AE